MRLLQVLAVALLAVTGCKGNPVKCEKACRNYAELIYWKEADAEILAVPVEQRDALRKEKMGKFSNNLSRGVDMCTSKCMSANNDTTTNCLLEAKTADQARACAPADKPENQ